MAAASGALWAAETGAARAVARAATARAASVA